MCLLSLIIPGNDGIVGRKDFELLFKSAWKDIVACIDRLVTNKIIEAPRFTKKKQGEYTQITFANNSVIHAVQTKNMFEGLGASYGWFWIDDAMETSEQFFVGDETALGLVSRLRRPDIRYHKRGDGSTVSMLRGMVSSNPPPLNHWLHKLFGKQPGITQLGDDLVKHMQVETFLNPFVGPNYAKGIMAVQRKLGRRAEDARRIIFGEIYYRVWWYSCVPTV